MKTKKIVVPVKEVNKIEEQTTRITDSLINESKYFLKKNFKIDLDIPIEINGRLRTSHGRFIYRPVKENGKTKYIPVRLEMSKTHLVASLIAGDWEATLDTLRHELVHYALCKLELPFDDGDEYFERKLKELNVTASGATSKSKIQSAREMVYYTQGRIYTCRKCQKETTFNRAPKKNCRALCTKCKSYSDFLYDRKNVLIIKHVEKLV